MRHMGTALYEHLGVALIVALFVLTTAVVAHRSGIAWLRRPAWLLVCFVILQAGLGVGAWVTKFGFATAGYVAVQHSTVQIVFRSAHTVVAMLVLMTSIVLTLRTFRLNGLYRQAMKPHKHSPPLPSALRVNGGAA